MKHLFIFLIITGSWSTLIAQQTISRVHLKGGAISEGQIIEYQQGIGISLLQKNGRTRKIPEGNILRITQKQYEAVAKEEVQEANNPYAFSEKGVYSAFYFSTLSGEEDEDFQLGAGLHYIIGYQFNRQFGLGAGLGIDSYNSEEQLFPVFLECQGYLSRRNIAPYYALAAGYGLVRQRTEKRTLEAEGGWMGRASAGLRLGAHADTNVLVSVGYQIQNAYYLREVNNTGEIEEKTITYNRIAIRVGLIF
jgi:hypothetical protein